MERLTEEQFNNLLELTSIRPESATRVALFKHLVLGNDRKTAYETAGISQQAMSAALARLNETSDGAKLYVRSLDANQ